MLRPCKFTCKSSYFLPFCAETITVHHANHCSQPRVPRPVTALKYVSNKFITQKANYTVGHILYGENNKLHALTFELIVSFSKVSIFQGKPAKRVPCFLFGNSCKAMAALVLTHAWNPGGIVLTSEERSAFCTATELTDC